MPGNTTVMIVEDHAETRLLILEALRHEGYNLMTYSTALEAYKAMETAETLPDMIISDVMMPKMNGLQFCQLVKAKYKFIYFIIITAKNSLEDKIEGISIGADEYISKPFHLTELVARVEAGRRIIYANKQIANLHKKLLKFKMQTKTIQGLCKVMLMKPETLSQDHQQSIQSIEETSKTILDSIDELKL